MYVRARGDCSSVKLFKVFSAKCNMRMVLGGLRRQSGNGRLLICLTKHYELHSATSPFSADDEIQLLVIISRCFS
jgi:hypothetical protein